MPDLPFGGPLQPEISPSFPPFVKEFWNWLTQPPSIPLTMWGEVDVTRETTVREAAIIQNWTLGFIPAASAQRIFGVEGAGEVDTIDYILVLLAFTPVLGPLGRALGLTFRVTVPLTAKTFTALRVYLRALTGSQRGFMLARGWFLHRTEVLFGKLGDRLGLSVANFDLVVALHGPGLGNRIMRAYIGTRLVILERLITVIARSVPTQAAFFSNLVLRAMLNGIPALVRAKLDEVIRLVAPIALPFLIPEMNPWVQEGFSKLNEILPWNDINRWLPLEEVRGEETKGEGRKQRKKADERRDEGKAQTARKSKVGRKKRRREDERRRAVARRKRKRKRRTKRSRSRK